MKALLLISGLLMVAAPAFATEKTVELNNGEAQLMIHLFNDYGLKGHPVHGVCFETSTEITLQLATVLRDGRTIPDDLAMLSHDNGSQAIVSEDKIATTALFDRAGVPQAMEGSALLRKGTITSYGCEMSPSTWTIKFDDGAK